MQARLRTSVVWRDLPDAIALADAPVVVLIVPGAIGVGLAASCRATARRTDRESNGAFAARLTLRDAATVVVEELQWADDASLEVVVEHARRRLDASGVGVTGGQLVAVWRAGARRAALAELAAIAHASGSVVEVVPESIETLVAAGFDPAAARRLLADTGGLPDLVEAAVAHRSIDAEIGSRLDLLDDATALAAQVAAFGGRLVDRARDELVLEGLVPPLAGASMPDLVAAAIRARCTGERRGAAVALAAQDGDALVVARHLSELDEQSPWAARWYRRAATQTDGLEAVLLGRAARRCGADDELVRRAVVAGLLDTGRAAEAIRELGDGREPADHAMRARAWVLAGDPAAAASEFRHSGEEGWARWAAAAAGIDNGIDIGIDIGIDHEREARDGEETSVAAQVGVAARRWQAGPLGEATEVLALLATAARRQRVVGIGDDPVVVAAVGARLAERFGDHGAADRAAVAAVADAGARLAAETQALAAWLTARRGLLPVRPVEALGPRVAVLAGATRCAIAVRDDEADDLEAAATAASAHAADVGPDLFDLDVVTDIAAARERARADHLPDPIEPIAPLAERSAAHHRFDLAWCRLQASLAGDRLDRIADRARDLLALDAADDRHPRAGSIRVAASALVRPADADVAAVVDAARQFAAAGAPHLAARLCGVVALATSDDARARLLLRESRTWRAHRTRVRRRSGSERSIGALSEQEARIGRLVVQGHTHREIGAMLFISPKTVEHHVAHIRTKLGAGSRAEMLAVLRDHLVDV